MKFNNHDGVTDRCKHIDAKYLAVMEAAQNGNIEMKWKRRTENGADGFTHAHSSRVEHSNFCKLVGLVEGNAFDFGQSDLEVGGKVNKALQGK